MIKEIGIDNIKVAMARMAYCMDPHHRNHIGKAMHSPNLYLVKSAEGFVSKAVETLEAYRKRQAAKGTPGRKPTQFLSEIIYRCPKGAALTPWERTKIELEILAAVAGNSPACVYWHEHDDGTWDAHIFVRNCPSIASNALRKGPYGNGRANYWRVLHEAENRAVTVINNLRAINQQVRFESMPEAKARLAHAKGIAPVWVELASIEDMIDEDNIVEFLRILGHEATITRGYITITFAERNQKSRPMNLKNLIARSNVHKIHKVETQVPETSTPGRSR